MKTLKKKNFVGKLQENFGNNTSGQKIINFFF